MKNKIHLLLATTLIAPAIYALDVTDNYTISDSSDPLGGQGINVAASSSTPRLIIDLDSGDSITFANLQMGYRNDGNATGSGIVDILSGTVNTSGAFNVSNVWGVTAETASETVMSVLNVYSGGTLNISNGGDFHIGRQAYNQGTINVDGGTINLLGTGNRNLLIGNAADSAGIVNITNGGKIIREVVGSGNANINVANGARSTGTLNISGTGSELVMSRATLIIGEGADSHGVVNITDGGKLIRHNDATTNLNILIGQGAGSTGELNISGTDSALSTAGYMRLAIGNNSIGNFTMDSGALVLSGNAMDIAYGSNSTANFTMSGGSVTTSRANFGVGANSTTTVKISGGDILDVGGQNSNNTGFTFGRGEGAVINAEISGGSFSASGLSVGSTFRGESNSSLGDNVKSTLILKGTASFDRYGTSDTIIGVNQGVEGYTGNESELIIHTGATITNSNNYGQMRVYDSGSITLNLDSSGYNGDSTPAMISHNIIYFYSGAGETSETLIINGAFFGDIAGLEMGDTVTLDLFQFNGNISFNEVNFDKNADHLADFLSQFTEIKGFDTNRYWESVDFDDFSYASGVISLTLTYVPEPSTYAICFGFAALAIAAYRRKK